MTERDRDGCAPEGNDAVDAYLSIAGTSTKALERTGIHAKAQRHVARIRAALALADADLAVDAAQHGSDGPEIGAAYAARNAARVAYRAATEQTDET